MARRLYPMSSPHDPAAGEADVLRERLSSAREKAWRLEQEKRALESEVTQWRLAEELARGQSEMLIQSLAILASDAELDTFLGHILKATVDQLGGVGGTLWFPDRPSGTARLHLEYVDSRIVPAHESRHPAVRHPPPIGGEPLSTFPDHRAETYALIYGVSGMPEENRAYIMSLGVRVLLTVPMILGKETVGWMCIRSRRIDSKEMSSKIRIAAALAGQATLAMQMARLTGRAQQAAVLEERNRIARDIHDTLAQGFTGVIVNLQAAHRAMRKDNEAQALEHLEHAQQLAQSGLEEARHSVGALRPDHQSVPDLSDTIGLAVRRVEETGLVAVRYGRIGQPWSLPPRATHELGRIAQESITNMLKHARASAAEISLEFDGDRVILTVADNGVGFDSEAHHEGFGLTGIRERADRIGASLEIATAPGQGTRVTVRYRARAAH